MRLLLVQEARIASKTLPTSLEKLGHDVQAADERSYKLLAREFQPEIVLLDLIPFKCLEILKVLRAHPVTEETPLIVLSARPTKQLVIKAIQAGASNFIDKGAMSLTVLQEKIGSVSPNPTPRRQVEPSTAVRRALGEDSQLKIVVISPRKHLGQLLRREMKKVLVTVDSYNEQLLKEIISAPPHVVLIDDALSNVMKVASAIRGKTEGVGTVLISGSMTRDKIREASSAGISRIIVRPFSPPLLLKAISEAFEKVGSTASNLLPTGMAESRLSEPPRANEVLDRLLQVEEVKSLPHIIERVLFISNDKSAGATELEDVILSDANAASVLLKRVNSPYYAGEHQITRVRDAITRIGFEDVRALVMTLSVIDNFGIGQEQLGFDRLGFWKASLATAILSREMAQNIGASSAEDAFLGGLLADFGKMIFDENARDEFVQAISLGHEKVISLAAAEKRVLGVDHSELGAQVLAKWSFPQRIVELVRAHESMAWQESAGVDANLAAVIGLAKWIVLGLGIGDTAEILYDWVPGELLAWAKLDGYINTELLDRLTEELSGILSYFDVPLEWPPECAGERPEMFYYEGGPLALSPLELIVRRLGGVPTRIESLEALDDLPEDSIGLLHFSSAAELKEAASDRDWGPRPLMFFLPRGQVPTDDGVKQRVGLPLGACRYTEHPFSLHQVQLDVAELGT